MSAEGRHRALDLAGRPSAALVTPLPPRPSGVATYSLRLVEFTRESISWTVWYTQGSDPACLPPDIQAFPIPADGSLADWPRFFALGNSPDCFDVMASLERCGGVALLHDAVMHHMLRYCLLEGSGGREYRRHLLFEYGPSAEAIRRRLSRHAPEAEYDRLLKSYPLIGRILHASDAVVCLNAAAASMIGKRIPRKQLFVVSHPLSRLPEAVPLEKPVCSHLVGMAGGGSPGRNPGVLLEAVRLLREGMGDVRAVFVGSGWPSGLPPWASCTGRLAEPEYQSWLRLLDAAADLRHPDCGETSGSLLELMRAGVPSVVSAAGSFLYLPSDSVVRVPVPPDPRTVASALEGILRDQALAGRMRKAASLWALEQGSPERARSDWTRVLSEIEPPAVPAARGRIAVSAAWDEPPAGFARVLDGAMVSWRFSGRALMEAPVRPATALVTAWGRGVVAGLELPPEPAVLEVESDRLEFDGFGFVSQVLWRTGPGR